MSNTKCRRCNHAIKMLGRDVHYCRIFNGTPNGMWVITLDASVVASGKTIDQALGDEKNWTAESRVSGLLPDVPWSARA